ncbi:E3 SUMO-protein ligase NSE2 isoform X2 [Syngnathoides biaculeatus]|uniref:E3 SUMO-protein ligase NSE2 isoform X2 n=1 Tax=Syngnathoides biaculeatus TaxID=300417 RepID=UPI002ADDE138|nr:E3 SUMO-protein ligase NSE2 isoform X2 [Syngnathoides biaculeatus]
MMSQGGNDASLNCSECRNCNGGEGDSGITEMEALMLQCAKLDREIDCFVETVQQATVEVTEHQQEALFSISSRVKKNFTEKIAQLSDTDVQTHQKIDAFRERIKSSCNQRTAVLASQESENMEEIDDDLAVTQTQVIFTCPLTQVDMVNPMKNKKCNHHYDENPIKILIETRRNQKKKCWCPVAGCGNKDVRVSDLVPDHNLKRQILEQKSNGIKNSTHSLDMFITKL